MLKHYLTLFFYNFTRYRLYSLLNVVGLGISLSIALIIGLFVHHQLTYERHFEHAERIYQIGQKSTSNRFGSPDASSPMVASRFPELFPSIEDITRSSFQRPVLLGSQGEAGNEGIENMECCIGHGDERFFKIFNVEWLYGDPDTALSQPDSVVLTRPLARKYFGTEEAAFGSALWYERERPIRVTGVIETLPDNTFLQFQALLSMNLYLEQYETEGQSLSMENWEGSLFRTYARFRDSIPGDQLLAEMQPVIDAELGELAEKLTFNIRPITRLYLDQNMSRVKVFAAIGVAILLIALINFVNLATARASMRAMEVGLKFSLGAGRPQLIRQFLFESFTMVILAMTFALAVAELLLPVANTVMDVQLSFAIFTDPRAIAVLALATIGIGLLAGLYPAFYLTSVKPVQGLKNQGLTGKGGHYFRSALVLLQFSVSITLMIATLIFLLQIRFTEAFDRGFEHEDVVVIPFPQESTASLDTRWYGLREDLLSHPDISEINLSHLSPLLEAIMIFEVRQEDGPDRHQFSVLSGSADFLQFYDIDLLVGEYFKEETAGGLQGPRGGSGEESSPWNFSSEVIVNEAALRVLEWLPEEAIGRSLYLYQDDDKASTVIGVVQDVVVDLGRPPEPYIYTVSEGFPGSRFIPARVNIRLNTGGNEAAMTHIRQVWADYFPDHLMQPTFLTERLKAQTRRQESQLEFFIYASVFAILVTCFGLFGLATFNAERRTKEIGVRKVMGGSVWSIVLLLTNDFSKLVLISNLIAWPVAYTAMNRWLENFAYRIDLTPLIFFGSGLIALCIAWVTVGGTAAKAASQKPVLALRYE